MGDLAAPKHPRVTISVNDLPSQLSVIFKESSFFVRNATDCELPLPCQVLADGGHDPLRGRPPPVRYPALNLLVKYGEHITIADGQCLWAIYHLENLPIPNYPEKRCSTLEKEDRLAVTEQLRIILSTLREIGQDPRDIFVGHTGRQPLQAVISEKTNVKTKGPFADVPSFHDWLSALTQRFHPDISKAPPDPLRALLPDYFPITLTHGDLHPSNIIVSEINQCRIVEETC
ncbi:hypothetical protein B0J14DRAFT_705157 [Halenospora varia]|nr:hypothetical protein B0J14DRAFT_705157 [Halenospora varia]